MLITNISPHGLSPPPLVLCCLCLWHVHKFRTYCFHIFLCSIFVLIFFIHFLHITADSVKQIKIFQSFMVSSISIRSSGMCCRGIWLGGPNIRRNLQVQSSGYVYRKCSYSSTKKDMISHSL
jgi:hypothetical protein